MKKSGFFLVSFIIATKLFALDLYVSKPSYKRVNNWEDIVKELKSSGAKAGINIIDYDSLNKAVETAWGPSDEDIIESLENKKEDIRQMEQMFSNMIGLTLDSGKSPAEEIAEIDKEIAKIKAKISSRVNPDNCYPRLTISADGDYNDCYHISASLYITKDSSPYNAKEYLLFPARFNIDEKKFLLNYMEAFYPLLNPAKKIKTPLVIDSRVIEVTGSSGKSYPFAIAPKDDFTFVLRRNSKIETYSPTWELKSVVDIPANDSQYRWSPYSSDGKNIVFGMLDNPNVYILDSAGQVKTGSRYKYPDIANNFAQYGFTCSGSPVVKVKDLVSGDTTVYFPQKDESIKSLLLATRWFENVFYGPENTVWVAEETGTVYILSSDGQLKKTIHMPLEKSRVLDVLEDGTFLTVSEKGLSRHYKDGNILWSVPLTGALGSINYVGGAKNGMYYLMDYGSRKVIRLAEADAPVPAVLASIRDNSEKLSNGSLNEQAQANLAIADAYFAEKSYSSALNYYKKYLELSPADTKTAEKKFACEVWLNKKSAAENTKKAIDLLDEYGKESAKEAYQSGMKILEKLMKQVPWDIEVQEMYAELKNAFSDGGEEVSVKKLSLEITEFDLTSLFPTLMSVYASNPSGYIEVKNTSKIPVKNISVTSNIRKYMDFPSKSDIVPEIAPGDTALVPVSTVLNQSVLSLKEATPVQIQLTLKWESEGKGYSTQVTRPVVIYKASALTWADTAMASCFVQPNDPMVTDFISKALSLKIKTVLSKNVTKAIQIADAMGSIPLTYMADPVTPANQVIDNQYAVDTVRFPAETLTFKGGDCDDMTTLFCSLMEGTSINSAFITTPGHIFAAFDTGMAYNGLWANMDKNHLVFEVNGHAWIPVECTSFDEGFEKAWTMASKELGKDSYEVTTLADAWKTYSSAPVKSEANPINLNTESIEKLNNINRTLVVKQINSAFDKVDYKKYSVSEMNFLARIYHLNGEDDKAIDILNNVVAKQTDYYKGYLNLATLYEAKGQHELAKTYSKKAEKIIVVKTKENSNTVRAAEAGDSDWAE